MCSAMHALQQTRLQRHKLEHMTRSPSSFWQLRLLTCWWEITRLSLLSVFSQLRSFGF